MAERQRGRRDILPILNNSDLIRRYWLDRAGIMFVVDPIRDELTFPTQRSNAVTPALDCSTYQRLSHLCVKGEGTTHWFVGQCAPKSTSSLVPWSRDRISLLKLLCSPPRAAPTAGTALLSSSAFSFFFSPFRSLFWSFCQIKPFFTRWPAITIIADSWVCVHH